MDLLCYGSREEEVRLNFFPCKNTGENIAWEEWHVVEPLVVFKSDYRKLLIGYFNKVFPLVDPTNGESQDAFDVCWDNWIGSDDWRKIIAFIKKDIPLMENEDEKNFFNQFIIWVKKQLEWADIIVVDGNQ